MVYSGFRTPVGVNLIIDLKNRTFSNDGGVSLRNIVWEKGVFPGTRANEKKEEEDKKEEEEQIRRLDIRDNQPNEEQLRNVIPDENPNVQQHQQGVDKPIQEIETVQTILEKA